MRSRRACGSRSSHSPGLGAPSLGTGFLGETPLTELPSERRTGDGRGARQREPRGKGAEATHMARSARDQKIVSSGWKVGRGGEYH